MSDEIVYRRFVALGWGFTEPIGDAVTVTKRTKTTVHLSSGEKMTNKMFESSYGVGLSEEDTAKVKKLAVIIKRSPSLPVSVARGLDSREVDVLYALVKQIRALEEQFSRHISSIWS